MKVEVVMNPRAGGGPRPTGARLRRAFERLGADARVQSVPGRRLSSAAARAARSADVLVAAGGDGTVNAVASAALESGVPLGVVPLGTLNHFARDAGLPRNARDAVATVVDGRTQRVDVGEADGHAFLNNLSLGLYPKIVRRREELRQRLGHGKWRAFGHATWHTMRRDHRFWVRLEADGQPIRRLVPFVFIGNNRYGTHLFALGRRERLDEGVLSLYVSRAGGRLALVRLAGKALIGRLEHDREFMTHAAHEIWIDAPTQRLPAAIDGERVPLRAPIHCLVRPGALGLRVPRRVRR